jgi:hypothetical protein
MADAEPAQKGMGCFAKGCLITSVAGLTFLIFLFGGAWFLYQKALNTFTSPQAVRITSQIPTDAQYQSATEMLDRLQTAVRDNTSETIEFTATDLNALIARHPNFANPRRQLRIGMAHSLMTLDMSVPLDGSRLPRLKGRWLNGTARFSFEYIYGQFNMTPKVLVANQHSLPQALYSENFVSSFNRSFTRSFMNSISRNPEAVAFWNKIRSMTVRDDKLVVIIAPEV